MSNAQPLVSVIVPIYNVEKYLRTFLDSVISQSYTNLEIILVDDGSPDNCGNICDEYAEKDGRIKVIHKENGGVSSARNAGIEASSGKWIYFADPDDILEHDLINKALYTSIKDGTDMCFFDYEKHYEHRSITKKALKSQESVFKDTINIDTLIVYFSGIGCVWDFIVKADLIRNNLQFDEKIHIYEDVVFKLALYEHIKSFSYVHKILYHYNIRENSATPYYSGQKNYSDIVYSVYYKMTEIIKNGNYPDNAQIVPNTRLVEYLKGAVKAAFRNRLSIKCDYEIIKRYMQTDEYRNARLHCDKRLFIRKSGYVYVLFEKPNRFIFTAVYFLTKLKAELLKRLRQ